MSRWRERSTGLSVVLLALSVVSPMLAPGAWALSRYKTLHKFAATEGHGSYADLVFDEAGNLYGTTAHGNTEDGGTVFKLSPNAHGGWTESVLYSFCALMNCSDGQHPLAGVIFDQAGNLYGSTSEGGATGWGTIYRLTHNPNGSWSESVLHSFDSNGTDGVYPQHLIFDQAGNLYGTALLGGVHDGGVAFRLKPNPDGTWVESVLYNFCSLTNCGDGADPGTSLVFDQAGNLYGTTTSGGMTSCTWWLWDRLQVIAPVGRKLEGESAPSIYEREGRERPGQWPDLRPSWEAVRHDVLWRRQECWYRI